MNFRVQIVTLLYGISQVYGFIHLRHEDFLFEQSDSFYKSALRTLPTFWIEQRIDHFNETDQRTFKMKYFKFTDSWKSGGPIVLYINGEAPLNMKRVAITYPLNPVGASKSVIDQIIEETGAAFFMLEHRYYGTSQPFDELTTENLAFLSSRQALADIAHMLVTTKESPEFKESKVIVIGGSYAGNLAAWMKLLYPTLVDAALASSAPVFAKVNFNEYFEAVTDTFVKYRPQDCIKKTNEKFNTYRKLLQSPEGIKKLKENYHICEDSDMTVPENQQLFGDSMLTPYAHEAQYGRPENPSSACKIDNSDDLRCEKVDFNEDIKSLKNIDFMPWLYQTCTEFGYFQSVESNKTMFGNVLPVDFYYKTCKALFGEEFDEERVNQGVINTNRMYQGLTPNVTNVVFVNADMDPWHKLGVLHDLSPDAPSIFIEGGSHCADLSQPQSTDSDSLKAARVKIVSLLKKWIGVA